MAIEMAMVFIPADGIHASPFPSSNDATLGLVREHSFDAQMDHALFI
jgi:hypothetical protein